MKIRFRTRQRSRELRQHLTDAETILWSKLQRKQLHGYRFQRQYPIGAFIADFACRSARLVVEIDGATHSTEEERAYDTMRERFMQSRGWIVVRFWNAEIYGNLTGVLDSILQRLPPPSR